MSAVQYPFIDIAVHERVRERFAKGEALVLFSADVERVLWANGEGAALFGTPDIYSFLEQGPAGSDVTFRQLQSAARQLSATGQQRNLIVRIGSGFQRVATQATVELIETARAERAVLFSAPTSDRTASDEESARRMLEGFDDPDIHMAVLSADGSVVAASEHFSSLGLSARTARMLVDSVAQEADRLVKRPILTAKGYLPAAIGRLTDAPSVHLLFAIETIIGNLDPVSATENEADEPQHAGIAAQGVEASRSSLAQEEGLSGAYERALDAIAGIEDIEDLAGAGNAIPVDVAHDQADQSAAEDDPGIFASGQEAPLAQEPEDRPSPAKQGPLSAGTADRRTIPSHFVFAPNGRAIRFVWKIDAEGRFREVSEEFAQAVGPNAADVNGHAFSEIAALFDLDPDGKIAEALGKRDTWSGRTIYWPVESTTLQVPVDLAALPTYTRDRAFDGFRGFGIVRVADAIEDPRHLGLALGLQDDKADAAPSPDEQQAMPAPDISEEAAPLQTAGEEVEADDRSSPDAGKTEDRIDAEAPPEDVPASLLDQMFADDGDRAADNPVEEYPLADRNASPTDAIEPSGSPQEPSSPGESEKVVHLPDRRSRGRDGLTPVEQAAFREIARRLETFGKRAEPPAAASANRSNGEAIAAAGKTQPEPAATNQPPADAGAKSSAPAEPAESGADQLELLQSLVPARNRMADGLTPDIIDQMPVALLIHNGDQLIHGNPEFMRLSGYTDLGELQQLGGLDALLQRHDLADKSEAAGGMMVVRADDAIVPVSARLQSVRWEQGSALMLALMPVDGSAGSEPVRPSNDNELEQPTADDGRTRLEVEVEELRSILETATDGVVIIGEDGAIRALNRSASALFNYDIEETRGKPFVMLFAHESQRAVADYLNGLAGHGVASVLNDGREVIGRESSGGFIPLFMTMGKLTASSGYCAVIRDITQWKRTEEELLNAKRAAETANAHKSDFLARVSHEIRTPLNAIIGFSDMMATERFGPIGHPRYVEYANDIGRSGRHVLDIVNDLLDISKIEAGEMDLDFVAVGLNEAISEAVALVQPQANSQRVIIRTALSQSVPQVVADLRSIKQIALNVLANAIRFTPSGGQIVVSTAYETNGSVVLRIRDTGIGMTRAELEQAMKPFRQVTTGTRKRDDGTGLGLPLTKAMVDANRAIFAITSAPNDGTLVEITFPSPRVLAD